MNTKEVVRTGKPDPENDFGDFQALVIAITEQQTWVTNQLLWLAWIAVRKGWAATMAHLVGNSRSTIYDWASVWEMFGPTLPDTPLWLYVGAARVAKQVAEPARQSDVANAILSYCEENNITPSELLAMITKRGGLPPITGSAKAEYHQNRIVLHTDKSPEYSYPNVNFTLRNADEEEDQEGKRLTNEEIRAIISKVLGSGSPGS